MGEQLGLTEALSIALGGMIGGGIYAVLGVVAQITGAATWFAFVLAGTIALCAGYSYDRLNRLTEDREGCSAGGSVTFVQSFTGNATLAGMIGWTLLFGYVGSMAMYAFAFGEFTVGFRGVPETVAGLPLRPAVSVLVVAAFVGLNLLGARATGSAENVLVAAKVGVLVAFGVGGVAYVLGASPEPLRFGAGQLATPGPVVAGAISFVAFQGWQLLYYDQESLADPVETIPRAMYAAIPVAVFIYVLVAVATVNLAPEALRSNPHTALATAAETMMGAVGMGGIGFLVISLSALVSTGSAINATLFSAGYFAKGLIGNDLLPDRAGDSSASGVPRRTFLLLGGVTAAFAAYGSLSAVTSFASLAFIVVFGSVSYLAFRQRDRESVNPVPPAVGVLGTAGFFPLMFYRLYTAERQTFYAVLVVAAAVLAVEVLYFERDVLETGIERFDADVPDPFDDALDD